MSVLGGVSGVRWSWGGGAAAGGLPPSPPEAAPLQRRLLCAENILLGRERRHKGRATGRVLLDVPLPLRAPSGARRVPKTRAAAINIKVICRRKDPGRISAGCFSSSFCSGRDELNVLSGLLFPRPTLETKEHRAAVITSHRTFRKGHAYQDAPASKHQS